MRYLATLFWGFILGHVAFFLGSSLESNDYDFIQASALGLVVSILVFALTSIFPKNHRAAEEK